MINCLINKLIEHVEPSEIELTEAFDEIFSGVADEINATSFITLLKENEDLFSAKSMCLSCAIKSARETMTKIGSITGDFPTFEIVNFKESPEYFDISFVMDIILSANEVLVSKFAFPFQKKQSFETAKLFDILSYDINENFYENFEKTNFVYLKILNAEPYYKYTSNILRKLPFDNILKITEKFLNPIKPKNQFLGVETKEDVERFANICLNISNSNTLVLNSNNTLPFASIDGETYIAEAWKNKIFTYILTPELLGFTRYPLKDLLVEGPEENKEIILKLLNNQEKNAYYDFTILNSALALYIVKKASSIMDGVKLAKKTIDEGLALDKLKQIQNCR